MGTTKVKILDSKLLAYDPYRNHQEAVAYILSKINTEFIIKAPTREERPELPEEALREAVANAIAHRNYRSNANIQICIYHDRVEIVNPGGLAPSMKPEELGTKSIPRNPLLFGILHRMEIVENIGSGIKRMRRICKEYAVEEPRFETDENWFTITFPRPVKARTGEAAQVEAQERLESRLESQLESHLAAKVILLLQNTDLGRAQISAELGHKRISGELNKQIKRLLEMDLIERTIPDKPTSRLQKYRLTEKGRKLLDSL
jgi:ATP-dependent DNA helicase RecG